MRRLMRKGGNGCKQVRARFRELAEQSSWNGEPEGGSLASSRSHLNDCERCLTDFRIYALQRTVLDLSAAPVQFEPDETFFKGLRARIARGPLNSPVLGRGLTGEESWAAAVLTTSRQLVPAMAMLLVLIIGLTLMWNNASQNNSGSNAGLRPSERVIFGDIYEFPSPTTDDILQTLVAVEDNDNGK